MWCVENTFLNLFHKYHLETYKNKKKKNHQNPLLSHSRSYFRWRGVSKALSESDKQWGTLRLCMCLIPAVFLFPTEKDACIFTGWQILRSTREGKGTAVYLPKSCAFPVFRRELRALRWFTVVFYAQSWLEASTLSKMNMLFIRKPYSSCYMHSENSSTTIKPSPEHMHWIHSRRWICALKKQVTFLILAWLPHSIMNDLNYTALFTQGLMNMKHSD